ncbi:hypothetical protein CGCA056_v010055 [Colletotrichum aenigma]|uniref:uncharacterized protein n=1 Tax=Colletotrichum aenigma TaxID=1215731 RepID=UPI0018725B3B|nr:uncharacterized protein CGCA056_v010055 [Colletotrichum aenigma]KAF5519688.1 hypothetical protein CGCA056_v010055 [Colletotrichum aenigma]
MSISLIVISTLLQLSSGCGLLDGRKDYANRTYGQTCVEAAGDDKESLAVCLLQRNSIDKILDCGGPERGFGITSGVALQAGVGHL